MTDDPAGVIGTDPDTIPDGRASTVFPSSSTLMNRIGPGGSTGNDLVALCSVAASVYCWRWR